MKIVISKEEIIEGLQKAASIIPQKTGAAYLRSIWLKAEGDTLAIMATDANIEFSGLYAAKVERSGLVGVQGRAFVDLMRQLPQGSINLTLDSSGSVLLLEQGRRKYKLAANDPSWFQSFKSFPEEGLTAWSGDFFQELLDKVAFCISDDDSTEGISCFYMRHLGDGKIDSCGLNGHQFAMLTFIHDDLGRLLGEKGILIQKKYMTEIKKWLSDGDIEININENRLFLRTSDKKESFSLPLATYGYPDYATFVERLKDPSATPLTLDRKECFEALGRIGIFNTDNDRCAYFSFVGPEGANKELTISAQGQDLGSADESMEVKYTGEIAKIAFPTKNLMDIMNHFSSRDLELTLTGTEGPCGISGSEDPGYLAIIMPMQIVDVKYYSEEDV